MTGESTDDVAKAQHLHRAVVRAPRDEAPRLAYADALAATEPEHAEYLRLSQRLLKLRRTGGDPKERTALSVRCQILLERHRAQWSAAVQPLVDACGFLGSGFVDLAQLDARAFLVTGSKLFDAAPVVHLELSGVGAVATELFDSPLLERVVSLSLLRNGLGDAEVEVLARSSRLAGLRWLDLGLNAIGPAGLEALAASQALPALAWVGLMGNPLEDPTPVHCDEYDATKPAAAALMAKYGHRAWLDARPEREWPPSRELL